MDKFLIFVVFVVAMFVATRLAAEKLREAMKAANPPAPPRRGRARAARAARATPPPLAAPAAPETEEGPAAVEAAAHPVVSRPARRVNAHPEFRGRAALRRAMVAREVLGPPLSLRPPRF